MPFKLSDEWRGAPSNAFTLKTSPQIHGYVMGSPKAVEPSDSTFSGRVGAI